MGTPVESCYLHVIHAFQREFHFGCLSIGKERRTPEEPPFAAVGFRKKFQPDGLAGLGRVGIGLETGPYVQDPDPIRTGARQRAFRRLRLQAHIVQSGFRVQDNRVGFLRTFRLAAFENPPQGGVVAECIVVELDLLAIGRFPWPGMEIGFGERFQSVCESPLAEIHGADLQYRVVFYRPEPAIVQSVVPNRPLVLKESDEVGVVHQQAAFLVAF